MVMLKMTPAQAAALHDILTEMNLEPPVNDQPLQNNFNPLTDYPLWPVVEELRQQIQIALFTIKAHPSPSAALPSSINQKASSMPNNHQLEGREYSLTDRCLRSKNVSLRQLETVLKTSVIERASLEALIQQSQTIRQNSQQTYQRLREAYQRNREEYEQSQRLSKQLSAVHQRSLEIRQQIKINNLANQ